MVVMGLFHRNSGAAGPLHDPVGDDPAGHQVGVFGVVDDQAGGLLTQPVGGVQCICAVTLPTGNYRSIPGFCGI